MSFFAALLLSFFMGDVLWWLLAHRRLRTRAARIAAALWAAAMLGGFGLIIGGRFAGGGWEDSLPRPALSAVFVWHLLVLPAWLVWELAKLPVRLLRRNPPVAEAGGLSRREFLSFAPAVIVSSSAMAAETQLEEFRVRRLTVPVVGLPQALDGLTIAHVSDLHVGRFTRGAVLDRMVRATNELEPDLTLLTGDLINFALRDLETGIDFVRELRARHGVFFCEGNHDLIESPAEFRRRVLRAELPFLRGEAETLTIRGATVQVLGLPWSHGDGAHAHAIASLDSQRRGDAFPILLGHHPHAFDFAKDFPLMLAGHTHGGQLMLNEQLGCGPAFFRYWSGLYRRDGRALVVSNGIGNWFPVRIGAPAEIVHITLKHVA
ncbi:MAG: metallophosphoesterase [Chthoniobacteraceae bacterium]